MSRKNHHKKGIKPIKSSNLDLSHDSDATFSFIAGYTSGGAPYGLTWKEYNPYHDHADPNDNDRTKSTNTQHGQLK